MSFAAIPPTIRVIPALLASALTCNGAGADDELPNSDKTDRAAQLPDFFGQYCTDCHGEDEQMGGLALHETRSPTEMLSQQDMWHRVLRMVRLGAMPPEDVDPRPTAQEYADAVEVLQSLLFEFDCEEVARPGHPVIQRLNRTEYNNTIRDLFRIELTPADAFPSDDVGAGFDNIGGVLSISPLLVEKYLAAAEQITDAVIDTTDYSIPMIWSTGFEELKVTGDRTKLAEGFRVVEQTSEIYVTQNIPATGTYEVVVPAVKRPLDGKALSFVLTADGVTFGEFTLEPRRRPRTHSRRILLEAGVRRIAAAVVDTEEEGDESESATETDDAAVGADEASDEKPDAGVEVSPASLGVSEITIRGPIGSSQPAYPESHRRIVVAVPDTDVPVQTAAEEVIRPLLRRAFRRPVTGEEVSRFVQLTESTMSDHGQTFEQAVAVAVQAILVSPDFLFRHEKDPDEGLEVRELNDHELAVRLSYFLWSSMPDEELFRLADAGTLREPETFRAQVRRMLQHEHSFSLVNNFAAQWLNLRNLAESRPDPTIFREFDEELRRSMLRETELVFRTVMTEDRSVVDLLAGCFTWVNRRLAGHYGFPDVANEEFVRVSLEGTRRRGVLTHASILTLTSYPQRTSPVQRGKWILENIFGDTLPPPPPDVPELETVKDKNPGASLREQMQLHRRNVVCASCHQTMDPLGLGLENFDAIGRWRDSDGDLPVDATGLLPSGEEFTGPDELIVILMKRRQDFLRTLAERMLVYATGRDLEYYDRCVIDDCIEHMSKNGNRFSAMVEAIGLSDAFRERGREDEIR